MAQPMRLDGYAAASGSIHYGALAIPHPSSFRVLTRRPLSALRFWYQAAAPPPWIPEIARSERGVTPS